MTRHIKKLSTQVANQIAAGEVIERPASVVKELLENSLDAGSDNITVLIKRSANGFISITDNGAGIAKQDLPLAICQHATSKLSELMDLQSIMSFGFRGEALASICSAAKLKVTSKYKSSKPPGDDQAWSLEVEGNVDDYKVVPASHPYGTTITVRDLFHNMPVRRRFLKSDKTEFQHIVDVFQKIALSNFNCGFTLISDDKIVYKLPKAVTEQAKEYRIGKIFGRKFIKSSIYFDGKASAISLYGWLGVPDYHRSQTDQQYFFLNNRMIRDKLILHAIKSVYADLIPVGRHPCYVLYLNLAPSEVDVNVHPTKHEVRFSEPRWVHQFISQQTANALSKLASKPLFLDPPASEQCVEISNDIGCFNNAVIGQDTQTLSDQAVALNSNNVSSDFSACKKQLDIQNIQSSKKGSAIALAINTPASVHQALNSDNASHSLCDSSQISCEKLNNTRITTGQKVVDINNNYIITKQKKDYYIVDLKSSYSYLAYSELCDNWQVNGNINKVSLMLKPVIRCSALKHYDISKLLLVFAKLGFEVSCRYDEAPATCKNDDVTHKDTGEIFNTLIISKVPKACRYADIQELLIVIARFVNSNQDWMGINSIQQLFMAMSMQSMGRLECNLLPKEQAAILDKLANKDYNEAKFDNKHLVKKITPELLASIMV